MKLNKNKIIQQLTYAYEIHECVINEGSSGQEKTASGTQIVEEEKFLILE